MSRARKGGGRNLALATTAQRPDRFVHASDAIRSSDFPRSSRAGARWILTPISANEAQRLELDPEEVMRNAQQLALDLDACTSTRRAARPRVSLERARALRDAHADRVLAEDEHPSRAAAAKCYVRIYYRSEGGEVLAFHAGPYTHDVAVRVRNEHAKRYQIGDSYYDSKAPSDAIDAEIVHDTRAPIDTRLGGGACAACERFVLLPYSLERVAMLEAVRGIVDAFRHLRAICAERVSTELSE